MQLEAEEPSFARLPEPCSVLSEQAHSPVSKPVAERDGLGINEVEGGLRVAGTGGREQQPDVNAQLVQATQPCGIGRQQRKGSRPVGSHQPISLFERGHLKRALQQSNGDDFRVGTPPEKRLRSIIKTPR